MAALFVPDVAPLETIFRAALIYLFLLVLFRVIGRHEFADLSPFQLILLLIISESVSEALSAGDDSLVTALLSAGTLLAISVGMSYGKFRSETFRKILSASPLKAVENGEPVKKHLSRELMTTDDLVEALRVKGIDGIDKVRVGYIESDGEISALLFEPSDQKRIVQESAAHQAQKGA